MGMLWVPAIIFLAVLAAVLGGYFLVARGRAGDEEIRKRLTLLELRNLQQEELPQVLKEELLSTIPLLNRVLARLDVAVRIDRRLRQADLKMNVGTFALLSLALFFLGLGAGAILHWHILISLPVSVLLTLVPHAAVSAKRRMRIKRFLSHFPEALEMFARSLRAGHSFTGAIQLVAQEMPEPIGPEFQKVFDEQNLGIPLRQALIGLSERVDALDVKFFVTAILIQRETGGNLAEIIDKISYVIRERFRIQGQLRIFTAQARLTGFVLALLPVAMVFLINILNPEYLKPLWFDRFGRFLAGMAIVLQVSGFLVIRKIIRIKI